MYREAIQKQGYTNNGQIFGDWIGREAKGGQGWITWHLSGNEWLQVGVRNQKVAKDFIPGSTTQIDPATGRLIEGGTTLNDINFQAVKRIGKDFEINGNFALEHWKAPIYLPGQQTVTTTTIKLTWYPRAQIELLISPSVQQRQSASLLPHQLHRIDRQRLLSRNPSCHKPEQQHRENHAA